MSAPQAAEFATHRPTYWQQVAATASHDFLVYMTFVHGLLPAPGRHLQCDDCGGRGHIDRDPVDGHAIRRRECPVCHGAGSLYWPSHHEVITERLLYGERLEMILGPPDTAKCVHWSEMIPLADGRRMAAADLVGQHFPLLTVSEGGGFVQVEAEADWNALEETFELVTDSGRRVRRNGAHPFLVAQPTTEGGRMQRTWKGQGKHGPARLAIAPQWTVLGDVRPGDLVAVASVLPTRGRRRLPDHEVRLLAYLIAEGSLTATDGSSPGFTQAPGPVLEEFKTAAAALGCDVRPWGRSKYGWRVSRAGAHRGGDWRHRPPNPATELLRRHGLLGKHSRDKRIPSVVFELEREQQALLVNRLYACDGTLGVNRSGRGDQATISFCSASEGLVEDLHELLLRFGVCGTIREQGGGVRAWKLDITRAADLQRFCANIGPILGKEARSEMVVEFARTRRNRQTWRRASLPEGLHWERVKSVSTAGLARTVAIHVPVHHTYLTTFFEHNSTYGVGFAEWTEGRCPNYRWLIASEVASGIATTIVTQIGETIAQNERYHMVFGQLRDLRGHQEWSSHSIRLRNYISPHEARKAGRPPSPPPPPWLLLPEDTPSGVVPISPPRGRRPGLAHPNVKAVGWRSGYTGVRAEGVIGDDMVSDKSSQSRVVTEAVFRTTHQKLLPRLTGDCQRAIFFGQRWAPRDFYGMLLEHAVVVHDNNPHREGMDVLEREAAAA